MAGGFFARHSYRDQFGFLASPLMVMLAGVLAVAIAFGLWRYNQRQGQSQIPG